MLMGIGCIVHAFAIVSLLDFVGYRKAALLDAVEYGLKVTFDFDTSCPTPGLLPFRSCSVALVLHLACCRRYN